MARIEPMTTDDSVQVSVLGLGAMGAALAGALVESGYATTVWNRSAGKADGSWPPGPSVPGSRIWTAASWPRRP
ncbi:NAD(P)-binding domain-containing protein [Streptomyces niveus]|uniref:NAD(P)-binding domain-containing protein n=1 Tax=Streptomyces niveus TaxID=193462 RepID=UPI003679CA84